MASSIHFQILRDQKVCQIELEPIDVWARDEVLVSGHRYHVIGDVESVLWLRQKISSFNEHADISFEDLRTKLLEVGAKGIKMAGKTHAVGMAILTLKNIEEIHAKQTKLQREILQCKNHIEQLEHRLKSKGVRRNKPSISQQITQAQRKLVELEKAFAKSKKILVNFYHKRLEEKTNIRLKLQADGASTEQIMKAKAAEMDAYLLYMQEKRQFRGAVLIQDHGRPVLRGAYGPRNSQGDPNTPTTRFCIGSITKQFTGAAVALLMQKPELIMDAGIRAKFSLRTPINDLLPEKYRSEKWNDVVLEDLLRHTSGIPSFGTSLRDERREKNFTLDELMARIRKHDLLFDPGEMWSYSNSGYVILGAIIEHLTGQSFETFLHDQIFVPCHMEHTGMISSYNRNTVAAGFDESHVVPTERHLSKPFSAGGIISTVDDLGQWDEALYRTSLFSNATKNLMFSCPTPLKVYNPRNKHLKYTFDKKTKRYHLLSTQQYPEVHYGFGIILEKRADIEHGKVGDILCHDGALPGFASWMARFIPSRRSVIVLGNMEDLPMKEEVQWHLEDILFG